MEFIDVCPVCKSKNIEQLTGSLNAFNGRTIRFGKGSYCKNCGVQFHYNTPKLQEILDDEEKYINDYLAKHSSKEGK